MKRIFVLIAMLGAFALSAPATSQTPTQPTAQNPEQSSPATTAPAPAAAPAAAAAAAAPAAASAMAPAAAAPAPAPAAGTAPAAAAAAPPAPVPNKGDVAWMLVSTALVLMMSVPALALFYGGMVRAKNILSVLMQVFAVFSLITVLWCVYGYSLAFTEGNPFFGGFSRLFLNGTFDPATGNFATAATFSKGVVLPELVFVAFQATFAAITVCLILGGFAERMKFSAVLLFSAIWFTVRLLSGRAHGVVLGRSGCLHIGGGGRCGERQGRLHLADGRPRLRGRHGGAHQRRHRGRGRRNPAGQAHRLQQGSHAAQQPAADDDRRLAAVDRLVRLQCRLRPGSGQQRGPRVHQHLPRDGLCRTVVDVR